MQTSTVGLAVSLSPSVERPHASLESAKPRLGPLLALAFSSVAIAAAAALFMRTPAAVGAAPALPLAAPPPPRPTALAPRVVPLSAPAADRLADGLVSVGARELGAREAPVAQAPQAQPVYIDVGPRIAEDFSFDDEVVFACVFGTPEDRYPVAGDSIEVTVDGRRYRAAFQPSAVYPGAKKVVLRVPGMFTPHTVVFKPIYDLGPDGSAPVTIVSASDGMGGHTSSYESPVERLEASVQAGRLRVK